MIGTILLIIIFLVCWWYLVEYIKYFKTGDPKAKAFLSFGIGSRLSLKYPGDRYEMGFEAIEEIEVIAAHICV